jgi:DNA repair exonuclease SbcCD ATPase subunit
MFVSSNTKIDVLKGDINEMKTIEKGVNIYQLYLAGLKGIPYILIDKIRPVLEKKINDLLSVTTNFMVKIEIDGTRIEIYLDRPVYNGKLILLNNASGFERFISSLAIRLALLEISQLPKANFMAIDEGWNSFDYNNINNVRTIFDFLVQKFDFILSISHIQTIREHCNQQIRLKKNKDGYSVIYWE